jgi:hypothetical protein
MVRSHTCGHCELESFRLSDAPGDQIGGPEGCEMTASGSSPRRGNSAPLFGGDDESVAGDRDMSLSPRRRAPRRA